MSRTRFADDGVTALDLVDFFVSQRLLPLPTSSKQR